MALNNTTAMQELPDLVVNEILCRLPTRVVVNISFLSKKWEDILSSSFSLDFDESGGKCKHSNLQRHKKFINVLKKSLLICQNQKQERQLDKFRLCMTNYICRRDEEAIVSKWLSYSLTRSVKEIDISLKSQRRPEIPNHYCLSLMNFVNESRSLTSLNLEYVVLGHIEKRRKRTDARLFPSLKKMSFNHVFLDSYTFYNLLYESPALESLSFKSCYFGYELYVVSSSLKSLVIEDCDAGSVAIHSTWNLESIRVASNKDLRFLNLSECYNLKYINVSNNRELKLFHVYGCKDVEGIINAPHLNSFSYEGYLDSKFSLQAPKLRLVCIQLWDHGGGEGSFDPSEHFPKLENLLQTFGNSRAQVKLIVNDYKMLLFPNNFRTLSKSILSDVESVAFATTTVTATGSERRRLMESLRWMAPSARNVYQLKYNRKNDNYVEPY